MKLPYLFSAFTSLACTALLGAAEPEEIKLWPAGEGGTGAEKASLSAHLPEHPGDKLRPAVVVCPGGGYGSVVMSYEGHEIAKWFAERGFAAFVLKYRVAPHLHPAPMHDVQRAMQFVRANAAEHKIDPQRIGVIGFSAGGHLAATAGTKIVDAEEKAKDPLQRVSSRPDFMILAYPVISMLEGGVGHAGSARNLLGDPASKELREEMSLEKQVTKRTPPTFIFQTDEDKVVRAENSVLFYLALRKVRVPAELHIFREGVHGAGLGRQESSKAWPALLEKWMQRLGITENSPAK
ncbi:MAG: acetyl esterase/lipase [Verrucomicrobiales bacterium]|jgi:acetyl esterase/lipase